jgi:hypothetical protein
LYSLSILSCKTIGLSESIKLKTASVPSIVFKKLEIYLPFIHNSNAFHSNIIGITVFASHLSVSHELIERESCEIFKEIKLFISLVKIDIFLIALSSKPLSTIILELNFVGITFSFS